MFKTASKLILLIAFVQLSMSLTIPLRKNEQFCTLTLLEQGDAFTGDYVISGYNEDKVNAIVNLAPLSLF